MQIRKWLSWFIDDYSTTPKAANAVAALWRLEKIILDTLNFNDVVQKIVDSLLVELGYLNLGYRVIILALVDEEKKILRRISYSHTQEGVSAIGSLGIPFDKIEIPLSITDNLCIQALNTKQPVITHNVADVFYPIFKTEDIKPIQERIGIKTTMIYPILSKGNALGVLIFSLIKNEYEVSKEEKDMLAGFTDVVAIAVQNSSLYTSLQQTSQDLQIANSQLQQLDKLKDEFVSVASHELRTPMTAIKSYLWMVLAGRGGDFTEKQKYYLQRSYDSVDRLIKLVNDMLNISRIESGRLTIDMSNMDIQKLAQEVVEEVIPRAQELGLTVSIESVDSLPEVFADRNKIKEVLFNLIGNSLKFTPIGGTIIVSFQQKDSMIEVKVKDTGKGIAPEDISKLFQKFAMLPGSYVTNQPVAQGTGLGLYICRSIIELHKGKIWAESEGIGKGTSFMFTLQVFDPNNQKMVNMIHNHQEQSVDIIHSQLS